MIDATVRLTKALDDRYHIERELGAGGMATVYLAHDIRHQRLVALKVLRPDLAAIIGAERFLTEIRTTANLQHPHILPLFDSGEAESFLFYVMPYVEGESLRDRLKREKQLPIRDAVRIATEVASALDYAHRHGIIQRDIKPENILLHDGSALVADFGIALAVSNAAGSRMTETGISLGTPHYMSPEQAMGEREITARSDVYALGVITYEMLLGEPPFTGLTAQAIVAKVLTERPAPIVTQRNRVPQHVEDAVLTALEKLPADRFGSAADFAKALEGGTQVSRPAVSKTLAFPASAAAWRRAAVLGWAAAGVAAMVALWLWLRPQADISRQPPSRLALLAGPGSRGLRWVAITPDGATVLFTVGGAGGVSHVMRQPLDASEATIIPGTRGIGSPSVSPDGQWLIGTYQGLEAYRISIDGGTRRRLPQELASTSFAAWGSDGSIWFSPEREADRGLKRLGGRDSVTRHFPDITNGLLLQQVLPDGRTAIVVRRPDGTSSGPSMTLDLQTGEETELIDAQAVEVRYTAGHLVYVLPDGTLRAVPFDPASRRILGAAVSIATGVFVTDSGIAQLAVAPNGTLAYIPVEPLTLVLVDRSGSARPATTERHNFHAPRFSPDGRHLSTDFRSADGRHVWILSLDQGTLSRATFDRDGYDATWTPDGRSITYLSSRAGSMRARLGIHRTRPGSAAPAESLLASDSLDYTGIWLRDGSALVTVALQLRPGSGSDIAIVRNGGRGPIEPLVASRFNEHDVAVSSDGRWLAFVSDQSGQQQVYVRPFDGEGDQVQVSLSGGIEPLWGPDGRELFYRGTGEGQHELIVANVRTQPQFEVTSRRALFPISDMISTTPHTNYDISPDGRTFAMVRRSPATRIMLIQNLPELVRRLRGTAGTTP